MINVLSSSAWSWDRDDDLSDRFDGMGESLTVREYPTYLLIILSCLAKAVCLAPRLLSAIIREF